MEITLITKEDEVIDYDNIVLERTETIIVPEQTEVVKQKFTVGNIKERLLSIEDNIQKLSLEQNQLQGMLEEVNKVNWGKKK